MQIMPRPFMNVRKQDGKIDVIGATDQTSRRQMFEAPNAFEHPPFMNGPQLYVFRNVCKYLQYKMIVIDSSSSSMVYY